MSMLAVVRVTRAETISSAWRFSKPAGQKHKPQSSFNWSVLLKLISPPLTDQSSLNWSVLLKSGLQSRSLDFHKSSAVVCFCVLTRLYSEFKVVKDWWLNINISDWVVPSPLLSSSLTMLWESKVSFRCSRGVNSTFLRSKVAEGAVRWKSVSHKHTQTHTLTCF